jgi:hypothetical protein
MYQRVRLCANLLWFDLEHHPLKIDRDLYTQHKRIRNVARSSWPDNVLGVGLHDKMRREFDLVGQLQDHFEMLHPIG